MKLIKYYILFFAAVFMTTSCEDQLNLQPKQSLSVSESLADFAGLETALYGAYDGLQSVNYYGRNYVIIPEVSGDDVYISINNSNRFLTQFRFQTTPSSAMTGDFWDLSYSIILRVNNIINNIDNVEVTDTEARDQVLGEAYAIRGMVHFDLLRIFAHPYIDGAGDPGVPIVLEAKIEEPPRNTIEEVYTQVLSDLSTAKGLMGNDVGPFRFTANAATALMARVYLYKEDWANAETAATEVINSGDYTLTDGADLPDFFNTSGNDAEIFTLKRQADETLGSDNLGQIFNPQGYGDIRVTSDIRDSYEEDDQRTELYYENAGEYFVGKFLGEEGVPGLSSYKIIRYAEMYLIRAEARAEQSEFPDAISDLNVIRDRVNATMLTGVSNSQVLDLVYAEKNREFAFEGHRGFDLWRTGRPLTRIQCSTGIELTAPCFIEANSDLRTFPIPQSELDVNQNMVQNDGY